MLLVAAFNLVVTVIGVVLVLRSLKIGRDAVTAAGKANELTQKSLLADERPWIKIDAEVASDLFFDEEEAYVYLRLVQSNTGKTPAIAVNVWRRFIARAKTYEEVSKALEDFAEEQRGDYAKMSIGVDIFPGQEFEATYKMSIPITDIKAFSMLGAPTPPTPVLVFWAGYKSTDSDDLHETARAEFLFSVGMDGHDRAGIVWDKDDIPAAELRLIPLPDAALPMMPSR